MRSHTPLWIVLSATALLVGCQPRFRAEETRSVKLPHASGAGLRVEGRNGSIDCRVQTDATEVDATVTIIATGVSQAEADQRLQATKLSTERDGEQRLVLKVVWPDRQSGDSASWRVVVPAVAGAELETSNGAVTAVGLSGKSSFHSSNGRVQVTGHQGEVAIDTSNGAVVVKKHRGALAVQTSNGSVQVDMAGADRLTVDTSNAGVALQLGPEFGGALSLRTSNGRMRIQDPESRASSDVGKSSATMQFKKSGPSSRVATSNGSISVDVR